MNQSDVSPKGPVEDGHTQSPDVPTEGAVDQKQVLERSVASEPHKPCQDLMVCVACHLLIPVSGRLQQLEQEVVGGEQAKNKELRQKQRQRKKLADQRKVQLVHALSENSEESENVLFNVYNSIQEEVHAKSQLLVKVQGKVGQNIWKVEYILFV